MGLPFLNRGGERDRLRRFLGREGGGLAVIYGRRRCGKSTLIQRLCSGNDLYYLADQRDALLQIGALAGEADRILPQFAVATYRSWDAVLTALHTRAEQRLNVVLDEFPYLVAGAPALPSIIQRYLDTPGARRLNFVLCGSSQRMMHGLVLARTAPLYGRSQEILKVEPLRPGWIEPALGIEGASAIEAYAVWGGVPRYWELARGFPSHEQAVRDLVLDKRGVLHEEPATLLLDDLPPAGQAYSLLSLIGSGCSRLSEIAGRMNRPSGSLTRPLANLIDLGYVRKEVPFGESDRTSKRTLYRLNDPFLSFFFRFLEPNRTLLELGALRPVTATLGREFGSFVAQTWESLARQSVPFLRLGGIEWGAASRWWGTGPRGALELDVVAESVDRKSVLIGEAKWSNKDPDETRWVERLRAKAAAAPFVGRRKVVLALWLKKPTAAARDVSVVLPRMVLDVLK